MLSLLVPSCLLFFSERGAIAPSWRSCACLLLSCQPHTRPCPFYLFFSSLATSPLQKNDLHPIGPRPLLHCAKICYTTKYKEFLILCEYMSQRRQQGVKRCEWASGPDL